MSCYHPIYAIKSDKRTKHGKHKIAIQGPLETSGRPDIKKEPLLDCELLLPCGKCIGCRMDYSRKWADRMMLEMDHSKKAVFITLTYNDKHLPATEISYDGELCEYGAPTLCKRDLQLFFKRLRKKFPETNLRYYACGEYGSPEKTCRPHYHIILFGLSLDDLAQFEEDKKLKVVKVRKKKISKGVYENSLIYTSSIIQEAWSIFEKENVDDENELFGLCEYDAISISGYDPIGFVSVTDVSWHTCAYVSRYVQKKLFQDKLYLQNLYECEPEFSVMSRRPGIGGYFPIDHPDVFDYNILHLKDCKENIPVPSYFIDFLANPELSCFDPVRYHQIKMDKNKYASDKVMSKLMQSDLGYIESLSRDEEDKLLKSSILKREVF